MILLGHPCYGTDVYEAENDDEVLAVKKQGYRTLEEIIELAYLGLKKDEPNE